MYDKIHYNKKKKYIVRFIITFVKGLFIKIQLTYNIILVSGVQHNASVFVYIAKWLPQ